MLLLMFNKRNKAFKVNRIRKNTRLLKSVVLKRKNKNRAHYQLTDNIDKVNPRTIVLNHLVVKL